METNILTRFTWLTSRIVYTICLRRSHYLSFFIYLFILFFLFCYFISIIWNKFTVEKEERENTLRNLHRRGKVWMQPLKEKNFFLTSFLLNREETKIFYFAPCGSSVENCEIEYTVDDIVLEEI